MTCYDLKCKLAIGLVFALAARHASGEVLLVQTDGGIHKYEAVPANWNQALEDASRGSFAGTVHMDTTNLHGCHVYTDSRVQGKLLLIDTVALCSSYASTASRAADAGAIGVIFSHDGPGLAGMALGDDTPPRVRAVMIEQRHGEALRRLLAAGEGGIRAELKGGLLISEDSYEEQFILRADELASTRSVNFLWHEHPEMLSMAGSVLLSSELMQLGASAPPGWFESTPAFVPLFNPSLVALEDGSMLAILRMSNGPGCPSVRHSQESSMDTRVFRNELLLAHIDSSRLSVLSHVRVEAPPLSCWFTNTTQSSGRQFLDSVHGPMDARLIQGLDGDFWLSFYAEQNVPDSKEVSRGMRAAPLHVDWRPCSSAGRGAAAQWDLREGALQPGRGCRWLASQEGLLEAECLAACDDLPGCNAVNIFLASLQCELRFCEPTSSTSAGLADADLDPRAGWRAGVRREVPRWKKVNSACPWLAQGNGGDLAACQRSCEGLRSCNAVLFSERHTSCVLERCSEEEAHRHRLSVVPGDWQAWQLAVPPKTKGELTCLNRAWIEEREVVTFPSDQVEKNWNLIEASADRLLVEYHLEPHIVLEARLLRAPGMVHLAAVSTLAVSRWPADVLHGVSNVRGGYCCLPLPKELVVSHGAYGLQGPLLLGCGHLQRIRTPFDQAPGDLDRFRRQAKSRAYFQFFYALRASPPFDVVAVSTEWCITLSGHFSWRWRSVLPRGEPACEAIQFSAGLALRRNRNENEVVVAYGINDCEAGLLPLPLQRVLAALRPAQSQLNVSLDSIENI